MIGTEPGIGALRSEADLERFMQSVLDRQPRRSTRPPLVTALPPSPSEGDEVYFVADLANGVIWHLRYLRAANGPNRWAFVGGSWLAAPVTAEVSITSTSYVDLAASDGPAITLPLSGDYDVEWRCRVWCLAAEAGWVSPNPQGVYSDSFGAVGYVGNTYATPGRRDQFAGLTKNDVLKLRYRTSAGGTVFFRERLLMIRPIKVG